MGKVEDRHSKGGWVGKEDLRYRAPHTQEPEREQIAVAVKLYVAWGRAFFLLVGALKRPPPMGCGGGRFLALSVERSSLVAGHMGSICLGQEKEQIATRKRRF